MTKYFLFFIFFISTYVESYCPQHVVDSYPETESEVEPNQLIVLYLTNFPFIKNLSWSVDGRINPEDSKKIEFQLVSKNHVVKTIIIKKLQGDLRHNQFLIKPMSTLRLKKKYSLVIKAYSNKIKSFETFPAYNRPSWLVKSRKVAPTFSGPMKDLLLTRKTFYEMACGPINLVYLRIPDYKGDILISELFDPAVNITKQSIEVMHEGEVSIGNSMCGGAYDLQRKHQYMVRFRAVDSEGKESNPSNYFHFQSP